MLPAFVFPIKKNFVLHNLYIANVFVYALNVRKI